MKRVGYLISACCFLASGATAQIATLSPPINCTINPLQTVELSASVAGIIDEVLVRPGQKVLAGDVIAKLDTKLAQADLELALTRANFEGSVKAAEAQRDSLERRVGMLEKAVNERAVSRVEYESTLLEYELAISTVIREKQDLKLAAQDAERARIVLEKAIIRSPATGTVGEDLIDPGENVVNRPIATIYVTDPMRVEAFVPVSQLQTIANMENPQIVINGDRENPVDVIYDYVSPLANLSSNTISVYFILQNENILPGYKCTLAQPK